MAKFKIVYKHCAFNHSNGYVNHNYTDQGYELLLCEKRKEIEILKKHILHLEEDNQRLLRLLEQALKSTP